MGGVPAIAWDAGPRPLRRPTDSWLDRVGESFERSLLNQDFSPSTVRNYMIGVKRLFAFLRDQGVDDFALVTREQLEDWQSSLREQVPPLKANSRSLYSTAVRQLLGYAAEHDIVDQSLVKAIVRVRTRNRDKDEERQPISDEHLALLMAHLLPRRRRMTIIDLRDRALFAFLLETGLRVSEALQVMRTNYVNGRVRQKGGSWVEFMISPTVAELIIDYVRARHDDVPYLWVKHGNNASVEGRLADSGVREIWRRVCAELGIPRFTTHQLRHTSATLIHQRGMGDQLTIANWLHHADTRTAHRYVKVSQLTRARVLEGFDELLRRGAGMPRPDYPREMLERRSPKGGRPRFRA